MNTKKVFFGFLALAFFAMAAVATTAVDTDSESQSMIERGKIIRE